MSSSIPSTRHGLIVLATADAIPGADTNDDQRWLQPVPQEGMTAEGKYDIIVYNTFRHLGRPLQPPSRPRGLRT